MGLHGGACRTLCKVQRQGNVEVACGMRGAVLRTGGGGGGKGVQGKGCRVH